MRHRTHALPCGIAGELSIAVQCDHILHSPKRRDLTCDQRELVAAWVSQEAVQRPQLAPLTLIAHPYFVSGIPSSRTMKQEKGIPLCIAVTPVDRFDGLSRQVDQFLVGWASLSRRVGKIGQQAKVDIVA